MWTVWKISAGRRVRLGLFFTYGEALRVLDAQPTWLEKGGERAGIASWCVREQ